MNPQCPPAALTTTNTWPILLHLYFILFNTLPYNIEAAYLKEHIISSVNIQLLLKFKEL